MRNKTIRRQIYFRLEEKLAQKLDKRIARAGFASRSDFFTAVAYIALQEDKTANNQQSSGKEIQNATLLENVASWVKDTLPPISEEEVLVGLHTVISDMLTPVIAMKGVDVAYENTWEDVRRAFHERFGVWVTESDVREAFVSFAAVNRKGLEEYRERQMLQARDS